MTKAILVREDTSVGIIFSPQMAVNIILKDHKALELIKKKFVFPKKMPLHLTHAQENQTNK